MSLHQKALECGITTSNQEKNVELFKEIIAGKQAARQLVQGNMAYVVNKVDRFLAACPSYGFLRDDLISEGFLTMARIAENVAEKGEVDPEIFSPQGMMSFSLHNAFLNMARAERAVPLTDALAETLVDTDDGLGGVDAKLDVLACCNNETERAIVRYRCTGFDDAQMVEHLQISTRHIRRLRIEILARYEACLAENL